MARIVAIGIATLDVVNVVDGYPAENNEVRAVSQRIVRGGNATNTLVTLSQLGHQCAWAGVIADELDGQRILEDLAMHEVDISACHLAHGKAPTSYVTLNQRNGSRTIVHYRDLPEYDFASFQQIDLRSCDWLHFEGRNVAQTEQMLHFAADNTVAVPRSVEIEKPREGIQQLFEHADILMFSRSYAVSQGYQDAEKFLKKMARQARDQELICAWGESGAYALSRDKQMLHSPAYPPAKIVDTLGAGDAFNAGIINAFLAGQTLEEALESACRLAGQKCGYMGMDFLK